MAAVANIIAEKSKLGLKITSRGAAFNFLLYTANVVLLRASLKPILDTQSTNLGLRAFLFLP